MESLRVVALASGWVSSVILGMEIACEPDYCATLSRIDSDAGSQINDHISHTCPGNFCECLWRHHSPCPCITDFLQWSLIVNQEIASLKYLIRRRARNGFPSSCTKTQASFLMPSPAIAVLFQWPVKLYGCVMYVPCCLSSDVKASSWPLAPQVNESVQYICWQG